MAPRPKGRGPEGSAAGEVDRPPGRTGCGLLGSENEADRDEEPDREDEADEARRWPSELREGVSDCPIDVVGLWGV